MQTVIYDYADNVSSMMLMLYGLLILVGIGFLIYGLFVMPGKECEFDGRPMKLKHVPVGFRILMQGFPVLLGIAALLGGALNLYDAYRGEICYNSCEVYQISGELSEVEVHWDNLDGDPEVEFVLNDEKYTCTADSEKAQGFVEGRTVTMEYGYAGDELLIYYIYAEQ